LVLRAETRWDDGTLDDVNIETIQPPEWVVTHQAKVGSTVCPPLDLLEMGLPKTMRVKVVAVEPCPRIAPGPGRVVLTTINHLHRYVCELTVEDENGRRETVHPTALHRFYRKIDNRWLHLNELKCFDVIHARTGSLKIVEIKQMRGVYRVFNMTVEGERLYQVSALGIFAHNEGCSVTGPRRSLEELLPGGKIPSGQVEFAKWYDGLTYAELEEILSNAKFKDVIGDRVRAPGGFHEWLKVQQLLKFKEWNIPMSEIQRFRTKTLELEGTIPGTNDKFAHTVVNQATGRKQTGPGAKMFDNELSDMTDSSTSLADFNLRLKELLKRWNINPSLLPEPFPTASAEVK
jgi:filamentous hemagglutinin